MPTVISTVLADTLPPGGGQIEALLEVPPIPSAGLQKGAADGERFLSFPLMSLNLDFQGLSFVPLDATEQGEQSVEGGVGMGWAAGNV